MFITAPVGYGLAPIPGDVYKRQGFPYRCIHSSEKLADTIKEVLEMDGAAVCEVFVTRYQKTEPKTSSKKLPDGKMVSAPLEDMYPFLSREELEENMYIPCRLYTSGSADCCISSAEPKNGKRPAGRAFVSYGAGCNTLSFCGAGAEYQPSCCTKRLSGEKRGL